MVLKKKIILLKIIKNKSIYFKTERDHGPLLNTPSSIMQFTEILSVNAAIVWAHSSSSRSPYSECQNMHRSRSLSLYSE